ncbi:hypothetical protein CTAYLR_010365 [Chrysophaeum taylorii]|uniref:Uncharacterized protein n=1 Tax=Chrysophaeum taylorii TaxID=2483200 RepID=A0AAD7U9J9_9STRA|nr:hypothetical protein CTAYLR_010365 [Chrysophaeum taylorii]
MIRHASQLLPARIKALTSVGQTLTVRALLVDTHLFRRSNVSVGGGSAPTDLRVSSRFDTSKTAPKEMLTKEVRHELRARGLDPIGKAWTVKKRLEEARELEAVARIGGDAPRPAPSQTPDLRAKYAEKLRHRMADGAPSAPTTGGENEGDAAALQAAREAVASFGSGGDEASRSSSRWRIGPPGMRTLLEFAAARSMFLVLLTRLETSEQELSELLKQAAVHFDVVQGAAAAEDGVRAACCELGLEPHQTLAFVDDVAAARGAGRAGALACVLLREEPSSSGNNIKVSDAKRGRSEHVVSACSDVVNIINDLNGISYRAGVPVY